MCNRGVVVLVMLALKVFVKSAYGLSEQRLDEWQPNRPSKITCTRRPHQVRGGSIQPRASASSVALIRIVETVFVF